MLPNLTRCSWARERLPKQRPVARKGRTAEGLLYVCVQCRCLPLPSKDRDVADRFTSREKMEILTLCLSNSSAENPRSQYPTLVVASTSFSTDQLHLASSNCTSCRSHFTFVGHRPRGPSSLPPSPSASLVLSTELLPSLMLLLSLELPRWRLIALRCVLAANVSCS